MPTANASPVYELAAVQEDALSDLVLAKLFTDKPVKRAVRADDTRQHWQWFARTDVAHQGSRLWLDESEPITDTTVAQMKDRAEKALAPIVPKLATRVTVTVRQTALDEVAFAITISRPRGQEDTTLNVTLQQGGY